MRRSPLPSEPVSLPLLWSSAAEVESGGDVGGKLVHFDGPLAFTADDLLCATAEITGKSTYGRLRWRTAAWWPSSGSGRRSPRGTRRRSPRGTVRFLL